MQGGHGHEDWTAMSNCAASYYLHNYLSEIYSRSGNNTISIAKEITIMPRGKDSGNASIVRQFSTIDWAGIGESFRLSSRRFLNVEKEEDKADLYDLPSMAEPNYIYTDDQSSKRNKVRGMNLQTKRVSFHEDIMEDGQHIKDVLKEVKKHTGDEDQGEETTRRSPWYLVITFLVTIAATCSW